MTRVLLVANRGARLGARRLSPIVARLERDGVEVIRVRTSGPGSIDEAIRQQGQGMDAILVGGGDGTLNAALPAILAGDHVLGVIPLGTANDFARTLGIPRAPLDAARLVLTGRPTRVDVGEANGHPYLNVASIGLSVATARALTPDIKRRWGPLAYPLTVWRLLREGREFDAIIRANGEEHRTHTIQLAVGNGRFYGGGLVVHEQAQIDDGILHVYALKPQSRWRLLLRSLAFRAGRHDADPMTFNIDATEVEVETMPTRSVNTDGEITTRTPARFRVVRDALKVLVPRA